MKGFVGFIIFIMILVMTSITVVVAFHSSKAEIPDPKMSSGSNGDVEVRCIAGYKFVLGRRGEPAEVLDTSGHGIECQ